MAPAADIDRLIEEGLNRYGTGDLDGALLIWEQALAIDPDNAQANSYVDYVRLNYEVLQTDAGLGVVTDGGPAPFGIEDEPEYIIEISRGEIGPGDAPMYIEPTDEGWFIEEEQTQELYARTRTGGRIEPLQPPARTISADLPPKEIELEADEPPELELAPPAPRRAPSAEVNFDSATREYGNDDRLPQPPQRDTPNEFSEEPSSFRTESTPLGFSNLETEIRKRDLGFVQPTQGVGPPAGPAPLEVRLRTPSASQPAVQAAPPADLELGGAGRTTEPTTSELGKTARGIPPVSRMPAPSHPPPLAPTEDDLIASLPSPRRLTPLRGSQPPPLDPASRIPTRELPEKTRPPAPSPTDRAETKQGDDEDIALPSASTRDLGIREISLRQTDPIGANDFAVSAPTRDLGLRMPDAGRAQPATKRPPSVFPDEDAPTRQNDARQIREEYSTQKLKPIKRATGSSSSDGTRKDIVLPFDPIDARTAQILEAIEPPGGEPAGEVKEDRTRRRITALIERSTAWSAAGELDKAVAAVDLALSEDPDTALAQKLIHRNRDAIMNIFQAYLGDLERQPQLARPLHELSTAAISPRAAFLLSRIDGTLTIDEILDVSGMPRLEAYRHLCQLFLRGILR
ncbi:MAG TPA: hypothetical protein VFQ65_31680 [Kofleriaceae bacterium]|nr:hypothetical protein [Kofleriaceae bacterium]